jgi:Ring finger domain
MEDGLENGDDCSYFDSDMYQGSLTIPRDNHPTVPNYCVICLEEYQPADRVVWSHQCEHAFHRDCIVKYFDKIQRKVPDTPCPCCRATYTDLTVELRAKKRVGRARRGRTTAGAIIAGIPWFR